MSRLHIYYIFILKQWIIKLVGPHYPVDIIRLIIQSIPDIKVSCGDNHTIFNLRYGNESEFYACGNNDDGRLGLGDLIIPDKFQKLNLPKDTKTISCGGYH